MNVFCSLLFAFTILLRMTAFGQESAKSSSVGAPQSTARWDLYGGKLTIDKATALKTILRDEKRYANKEVLIGGTISEVCQNKGCWMVVDDSKSSVRVEFKDYKFFVPWNSEGKQVVLQGRLTKKTISDKVAEHMAGEMQHPPIKKHEIKQDQTITVFVATGVKILGGGALSQEQQDVISGDKERGSHQRED